MPPATTSPSGVPPDASILSVSQLNRAARRMLEEGFPGLWVAGEISNLARPGSGHIYFTLKDANAEIRCAMFRGAQRGLAFKPENGAQVIVRGAVSVYEARGSYQIIVSDMVDAGEGLLRRQFEELKAKLAAAGLFDEEHKQPLPALPQSIGVITSPTGAAIRDILNILNRRYSGAAVTIYPTRVQGDEAEAEIAAAIETADARQEVDVLIVARGGGSLEDLWSFNTETVARAIFACTLPTVAGVGHEIDVTIADLVADVRAPTPSGAAELVVPDVRALAKTMQDAERRIIRGMKDTLDAWRYKQQQLERRLRLSHPGAILQQWAQRNDELTRRLTSQMLRITDHTRETQQQLVARLLRASPEARIDAEQRTRGQLADRLRRGIEQRIANARMRAAQAAGQLNAVSPLAILERGYAVITSDKDGTLVKDAAQVAKGDTLNARLGRGSLIVEVVATRLPEK